MKITGYMSLILLCMLFFLACNRSSKTSKEYVQPQLRYIEHEIVYSAKILPFSSSRVYPSCSGAVYSLCKLPGDYVVKGAPIMKMKPIGRDTIITLVAPVSGMLIALNYYSGDIVDMSRDNNAKELFEIADVSKKMLVGYVDEIDIAKLKTNMPVSLVTADGIELVGKIYFVNLAGEDNNGTTKYKVCAYVDDKNNAVKYTGNTVAVKVELRSPTKVLALDKKCLVHEENSSYVFLLKHNLLTKQQINTGMEDDNYVEVTKNINLTDTVVYN